MILELYIQENFQLWITVMFLYLAVKEWEIKIFHFVAEYTIGKKWLHFIKH